MPTSTPACFAVREMPSATGKESIVTEILTRFASSLRRFHLLSPHSGYTTLISKMPACAMTSASASFATVIPAAPYFICSRAISGILCVFVCGRSARPCFLQYLPSCEDYDETRLGLDQNCRGLYLVYLHRTSVEADLYR